MARTPRYKTPPDAEQVRRRLYWIAMNADPKDAVAAARVLLADAGDKSEGGPDEDLLAELAQAMRGDSL